MREIEEGSEGGREEVEYLPTVMGKKESPDDCFSRLAMACSTSLHFWRHCKYNKEHTRAHACQKMTPDP